ncbi:hypothetical protein [Gallibacterium genomosp. 3]|uniref:hypothetical protein n=1 Tax=Gallibacterium genomosp. 3 TaxID=505345 RepID=UPI0008027A88|nr:hypothetical protein [Gallibacterium genomosp. 3]
MLKFYNRIKRHFFYYHKFRSLLEASNAPVNPYAFIRVHNEIHTVKASLTSIEGVLTRGVIGYHDCTDGTEEFILEFCSRNKGFIPHKYEYSVWPPDDNNYFDSFENSNPENRLDSYYNSVLDKIPNYEWLIKIDCDQIYDKELLRATLRMPLNERECIFLPRINMHYLNNKLYILRNSPLSIHRDHWLVYKTPKLHFIMSRGINNVGKRYAWELLELPHLNWIDTEVMHWHFPLMKVRREELGINMNSLILLENSHELLEPYRQLLLPNMINPDYILNTLKSTGLKPWR